MILTNILVHDFSRCPEDFEALCYGQDFGFNHANMLLAVAMRDGELYILKELFCRGKDTAEIIALAEKEGWDKSVEMFCDNAEPDRIRTWRQASWRAVPVKKEQGSVKAQIDWLKRRRLHIHPTCIETIKEVQNWRWKKDPLSGLYLDEPEEFTDDAMAALRYSIERWRRGSGIQVLK